MNRPSFPRLRFLTLLLPLGLGLALPVQAQTRGYGGGGGGFGGGGATPARNGASSGSSSHSYANAASIGDAYFSIDPETRRVVAIADEGTMQYISQVLSNLDRPKPQVLIKVAFVEVTHNNAYDIGIEGGWKNSGNNPAANAANVFGLSGLGSVATNVPLNALGQPVTSFLPSGPITSPGAGLYQVLGENYQVTLRAIAQAGNAKILSRPSVLARNNQPAHIFVGQRYPVVNSARYDNYGNVINSFTYQEVGITLDVTPFITADGLVEMIVAPSISAVSPTTSVQISTGVNVQAIDERAANTVVVTGDKQTVIIGGLMQDAKAKNETKIPLLGDIPLLGVLFKRQQSSAAKTELLVFLQPQIVQNPTELAALSTSERGKSDAIKELKERDINKFLDTLPMKEAAPVPAQPNSGSPPNHH
jgi:general secretion pathway protein D